MHSQHEGFSDFVQFLIVFPFLISLIAYLGAVIYSNRYKKRWSNFRTICWILGHICIIVTFVGPFAELAHLNFSAHMIAHLLFGMLAPLLIALAAPITQLLRSIPVKMARCISSILKKRYFAFVRNPIVASILNIGGLWLLYTTPLFYMMHESPFLFILIHAHIFLAGYIFTIAFIYIDPTPHPFSYIFRSIVLLIALAAHSILPKYIYANPLNHVPTIQAETGAMIMYYGGDIIEIGLVYLLFYQWYKSTRHATSTIALLSK